MQLSTIVSYDDHEMCFLSNVNRHKGSMFALLMALAQPCLSTAALMCVCAVESEAGPDCMLLEQT